MDEQRTIIAPYVAKNVGIYVCPADTRVGLYDGTDYYPNSPLKGTKIRTTRSVSLSQEEGTVCPGYHATRSSHSGKPTLPTNGPWLTGVRFGYTSDNGSYATFGKTTGFRAGSSPSQVFLMADESQFSINDAGLATCADLNNPRLIDYPSSAHSRGCGFSFCDGHAELHKWKGNAIVLEKASDLGKQPTSPLDIVDFQWLAIHSSVKIR